MQADWQILLSLLNVFILCPVFFAFRKDSDFSRFDISYLLNALYAVIKNQCVKKFVLRFELV